MSAAWFTCDHCGGHSWREVGAVNRALKRGAGLYCSKTCFGLGRRINKSIDQKKAEKAEYDRRRRQALGEALKASKREAYRAAVAADPERIRTKERVRRQANMARHVEYCRRPEYRQWKSIYDRKHRAQKDFGDFSEAALVLLDLEREILGRASRYDIALANGLLNKRNNRRRNYDSQANGS